MIHDYYRGPEDLTSLWKRRERIEQENQTVRRIIWLFSTVAAFILGYIVGIA